MHEGHAELFCIVSILTQGINQFGLLGLIHVQLFGVQTSFRHGSSFKRHSMSVVKPMNSEWHLRRVSQMTFHHELGLVLLQVMWNPMNSEGSITKSSKRLSTTRTAPSRVRLEFALHAWINAVLHESELARLLVVQSNAIPSPTHFDDTCREWYCHLRR